MLELTIKWRIAIELLDLGGFDVAGGTAST